MVAGRFTPYRAFSDPPRHLSLSTILVSIVFLLPGAKILRADADLVETQSKISCLSGGFDCTLCERRALSGPTSLGDFDGDGVIDLLVGTPGDAEGGVQRGAAWILLLNADGTVKAQQKINDVHGGFTGHLDLEDGFGTDVTSLGDLDGDLVTDVAVGAFYDDDGGYNKGAVWILFLNADATVKSHQKISQTQGGFAGTFYTDQRFGSSTSALGDVDGDGVVDIVVGVRIARTQEPPQLPANTNEI